MSDQQRRPVAVTMAHDAGGGIVPRWLVWEGDAFDVEVTGTPRLARRGATAHYAVPVSCGGMACTLHLDMDTWSWTLAWTWACPGVGWVPEGGDRPRLVA